MQESEVELALARASGGSYALALRMPVEQEVAQREPLWDLAAAGPGLRYMLHFAIKGEA